MGTGRGNWGEDQAEQQGDGHIFSTTALLGDRCLPWATLLGNVAHLVLTTSPGGRCCPNPHSVDEKTEVSTRRCDAVTPAVIAGMSVLFICYLTLQWSGRGKGMSSGLVHRYPAAKKMGLMIYSVSWGMTAQPGQRVGVRVFSIVDSGRASRVRIPTLGLKH